MKEVDFFSDSRDVISKFPKAVKFRIGKAIQNLQMGKNLSLPLSKPMFNIVHGVHELRIKGADGIFRVFYYLKIDDRIIILHAFQKKTQKTPTREIQVVKSRLKEIQNE